MATKRKVSEILDTLSEDGVQTEAQSLSKRSSSNRFLARLTQSTNSLVKRRRKDATEESKQPLSPSTYAPWSREQFLQRLSTYHYRNWSVPHRLQEVSPLECSKRGWIALPVSASSRQNTLQCVHCENVLSVNVGMDETVQVTMAHKYAEMLVSQHADECPWRHRGCDETVYTLPLTSDQRHKFYKRYDRLCSEDEVKNYSYTCTPQLTEQRLAMIPVDDEPIDRKAAVLALLGWEVDTKIGNKLLLGCGMCFRKVVLNHNLDLNKEHMAYCPFIQEHDGTLQWVHLLDLVKTAHVSESIFLKADARADDEQVRKSRLAKLKQVYFRKMS